MGEPIWSTKGAVRGEGEATHGRLIGEDVFGDTAGSHKVPEWSVDGEGLKWRMLVEVEKCALDVLTETIDT